MENGVTGTERLRSFLVLAATIGVVAFNWIAATGRLGGVSTGEVSDAYPTLVTPAAYAFSIWSLIYLGLIAFSIYQLLPANLHRFRAIRSPYIFTCALNCAWLYFWHDGQTVVCFVILIALSLTLLSINYKFRTPDSLADTFICNAPFGIYFGWVTAAMIINFAILVKYRGTSLSQSAETGLAASLILAVAGLGVLVRLKLANYFYPLAIAWALTAIAVRQSGQTIIVTSAAAGVVACLIASLSFVVNLPSRQTREP